MAADGVVISVTDVTLRDDVSAALDGDGTDALDAVGDLAPELVGTALGHFADTSTLADADALAPIVTAASPVPFDPLLDGVGAGVHLATPADQDPDGFDRVDGDDESVDDDPGAFDELDDVAGTHAETETETEAEAEADGDADIDDAGDGFVPDEAGPADVREFEADAFGTGDTAIDPTVEPDDGFEEASPIVEPFVGEVDPFDSIGVDAIDEPADDFAPIDVVELDVDPADGDFDIID